MRRRLGKELNHVESPSLDDGWLHSFGPRESAHKKTKGPRSANRMSIPWRQGTELGSQR